MPATSDRDEPAIVILDSITKLTPGHAGSVLVAGSHGGVYPAMLAAQARLRGVIFSDAGIGLDEAGIGGLRFLNSVGLAAAAVDYRSARIGDGADLHRRGVISHVNEPAARLGCQPGMPVGLCAERMKSAEASEAPFAGLIEGRLLFRPAAPQIWGIDSNSLAEPGDAGAILVSGSHGGLLGGKPASAIGPDVLAAAFNDAGMGIDNAGITRLAALDQRGIAAVTVSAASARIGDARSSWETGLVSAWNETAATYGARKGMKLRAFLKELASRGVDGMAAAEI